MLFLQKLVLLILFNKLLLTVAENNNVINIFTSSSSFVACECGIAKQTHSKTNLLERIIGGDDYEEHKFPWLVQLRFNGSFICGGSIISDRYILSAAHCLSTINSEYRSSLKVVTGSHNKCQESDRITTFSVVKILRHKNFNNINFFADIMLLKLNMKISFNPYARPICLPNFSIRETIFSRYEGKQALVIGWGKTESSANITSCTPRKLKLPILKKQQCGQISPSLFCAGFLEGRKDSCEGDSGGPLQFQTPQNKYEIIGIVSNGIGCALAGNPGLYTDVTKFLPWIRKHTRDSSFCWN